MRYSEILNGVLKTPLLDIEILGFKLNYFSSIFKHVCYVTRFIWTSAAHFFRFMITLFWIIFVQIIRQIYKISQQTFNLLAFCIVFEIKFDPSIRLSIEC